MKSKVVAIFETRTGQHLGELVARKGGIALLAPALMEVPDIEPQALQTLMAAWRANPYRMVIFQTGVGTKALFQVADSLGCTNDLLALLLSATIVARGPKPTAELNARRVRIDVRAAAPFTTETVLAAISALEIWQAAVLVQRYGAANAPLRMALEQRGARMDEFATYRWALPTDTRPLERFLDELHEGRVDAVVFTSAVQMHNLHTVAVRCGHAGRLAASLNRCVVASIGPVCSRVLLDYGIVPTFEAQPPKLGPLLIALETALGR